MGKQETLNQNTKTKTKMERELELQLELLKVVAEQNKELIFEYEAKNDEAVIYQVLNGEFEVYSTFHNFVELSEVHLSILSEEHRTKFRKNFQACMKKAAHNVCDYEVLRKNGEKEWIRFFMASVENKRHKVTKVIGRIINIQQEKIDNEMIRRRAEIDALTGVYNHKTFEEIVAKAIYRKKGEGAFVVMDVDDFKMVNDTQGHNIGDQVLAQTGEILNAYVGDRGYAGRLGGDEFALYVWGFENQQEIVDYFAKLRIKLKKEIIFDMEYSASIGIATKNGRKLTFKDLYFEADQATYRAKRNGKNQIVFYSDIELEDEEDAKDDIAENDKTNALSNSYEKTMFSNVLEYIFIADPISYRILYANDAVHNVMDIVDTKWMELPYYTLLEGKDDPSDAMDIREEKNYILSTNSGEGRYLEKYFPNSEFSVFSHMTSWEKNPAVLFTMFDRNNASQVLGVLEEKMKRQQDIHRYMYLFSNPNIEEIKERLLRMICENFDADFVGLIPYQPAENQITCSYHKDTVDAMARVIDDAIDSGKIERHLGVIDENGIISIPHVSKIKNSHPEYYETLVGIHIWSVTGTKLEYNDEYMGTLLIINPRNLEGKQRVLSYLEGRLATAIARYRLKEKYEFTKTHDIITRLWNRSSFWGWNTHWEEKGMTSLGILMTDVVGLHKINEEFGYARGNDSLSQVAKILEELFQGYRCFRYEDDTMLAFCPNISEPAFKTLVSLTKERLEELSFGVSCGMSWSENIDVSDLLKDAESVITIEKSTSIDVGKLEEKKDAQVIFDVEQELANGRFLTYLQPKVDIQKNRIVGAEALVRLQDEKLGVVSPGYFISILEEYNLVHMVDLYVFEEVYKFQKQLQDEGKRLLPISVNFSKITLMYPELLSRVLEISNSYDVPNEFVQIEITETVRDMDHVIVNDIAKRLHNMGFKLLMDDFGARYSNLASFVQFSFDTIKIDRAMVMDIVEDKKSALVLRHLISMIQDLNVECVIEGVETREQVEMLKQMNVHDVQGYFFGEPIPKEEFYRKVL